MQKFFSFLRYIFGIALTIIVVVYIFSFSIIYSMLSNKQNTLNKTYNKNVLSSVLDVWYIESFEGGSSSTRAYLDKVSRKFTNIYSGCYVCFTYMSREQYAVNIKTSAPDIISFTHYEDVEGLMCDLPKSHSIDRYIDIVTDDDEIICYPYINGKYAIVSRDVISGDIPNNIIQNRKNTIYPFGYSNDVSGSQYIGDSGYTIPSNSKIYLTQYEAYTAYLRGEITTLLASQRDVHRLKARESKGNMSPNNYIYLGGKTDLVQYIGVLDTSKNIDIAKKFCEYMISDEVQRGLSSIGMFSPYYDIYQDQYMHEWECCGNTILVRR